MNTSKFSALALPTSPGGANWAGHGPPSRNSNSKGANLCRVYVHTCGFHTAAAAGARVRASERTKIDEREDAS